MSNDKKGNQTGDTTAAITYEFPYMRKPKEKRSIWKQIYNKDKNKILGRTPESWGRLMLFYTIFYLCLAAFFAICIQGLLWFCPIDKPRWQLESSLIGTNPGLGFRPMSKNLRQGSLIWYQAKNVTDINVWVNLTNEFLEPYKNIVGKKPILCGPDKLPSPGGVCAVPINNFTDCSPSMGFSFNRSSPCVFLKLNKIYGWEPEYYDDVNNLPEGMPEDLVKHINSLNIQNRKQVWISCRAENPFDRESIGELRYHPQQGFPSYYFPYQNQENYLSPLVAVRFLRPTLHRIINVECRAWAKNIIYSGSIRDRRGSTHFELMID